MLTVYKYPIELADVCVIKMPAGAEILAVREVAGRLWLWALVDTNDNRDVNRVLRVAGTGHPIKRWEQRHIDTVVTESGLVWHVFDVSEQEIDR